MWEINNTSQAASFFYSIILGVIFALFYDFFRSYRIVKPQTSLSVFLEDILFFLLLSITTFLFLLSLTNGEIRGYVLIGILLGFMLFIFTLSKYYIIAMTAILKLIISVITLFSKGFYLLFDEIDCFFMKIFKNTLKYLKKCLKKLVQMLYTKKKCN